MAEQQYKVGDRVVVTNNRGELQFEGEVVTLLKTVLKVKGLGHGKPRTFSLTGVETAYPYLRLVPRNDYPVEQLAAAKVFRMTQEAYLGSFKTRERTLQAQIRGATEAITRLQEQATKSSEDLVALRGNHASNMAQFEAAVLEIQKERA